MGMIEDVRAAPAASEGFALGPRAALLNLACITFGCFLTYAIVSGMLSQMGPLSAAMAAHFDKPLTQAAALFSFLSFGFTAGAVLSLVAYEYLSLKRAYFVCYTLFLASLAALCLANAWATIPALLFLMGTSAGLGLNTSAVTLSLCFEGRRRAIALLCTDIFFAGAGIVMAPAGVYLTQQGWPWHASLWLLGGLASLVIAIALGGFYPQTAREEKLPLARQAWPVSIYLCAAGLACYLFAQVTMLIWLPNYLTEHARVGMEIGASAIGRYWTGMALGQLLLVFVMLRSPPQPVLAAIVIASVLVSSALWLLDSADALVWAALGLGLANAGILKLTIAAAAGLVTHPQRVVTFLLFSSAAGQALTPMVSSLLVERYGMHFALLLVTVLMAAAAFAILAALKLAPKSGASDVASSPAH